MKPLFTNNERRRSGRKPLRKSSHKKRYYSRNKAIEAINALIDWWDN